MSEDNPEGGRSPLASTTFLISALLVVALVIGGAWVLFSRPTPTPEANPSTSPTAQVSGDQQPTPNGGQESTESEASDSSCGMSATDASVPSAALPSVPVSVGDGLEVPSLNGGGPGVTEGISRCFAHTPTGALMAGANFMKWFSSKQQLPDVVSTLMAPSADRDHLEAQVRAGWSGETGSAVSIRGYHFEDRGPNNALVVLAVSTPAYPNDLVAWPLAMTWVEGDWKVVAPAVDNWGERSIQSLQVEGFVEWGA